MRHPHQLSVLFLSAAVILLGAHHVMAETFLVDFNTTDSGSYPGGSNAWNIYTTPAEVNGSAIHNDYSLAPTSVTLNKSGTITDSGNGGAAVFNNASGGPSWVTTDGSLANTGAAGDYFFTSTNTNNESFTMIFSGLTPGEAANLDVWTSRVTATSEGFYEYSLDGGSSWSGFTVLEKDGSASTGDGWTGMNTQVKGFQGIRDGNNNARYMSVSNLLLTGSTLSVRTTDTEGAGTWSAIGAIRLSVVPEPGTIGLALATMSGLALRRPRRRA